LLTNNYKTIGLCKSAKSYQLKSTIINENVDNRIKLKETRVIEGYSYVIIEVDGVEYLSAARSGIVRISK